MRTFLTIILFLFILITDAQIPTIQWANNYGGSELDKFNSIIIAKEIYYLVGVTESIDFDVSGSHSQPPGLITGDLWLTAIDSNGLLLWNKCYGGMSNENGYSLTRGSNGGFVLLALADYNDGDVSGIHDFSSDFWVVNINDTGIILWSHCYGGNANEDPSNIILTNDSNYLLIGRENSNDHDVTGNHGLEDMWALKIDTLGNIIWSKPYGGPNTDFTIGFKSCFEKPNGNIIILGNTSSTTGQVSGNHGGTDIWVFEIDSSGLLLNQKCFGGSQLDNGIAIISGGNGYFIAGITDSNNGDVSNYIGGGDFWLAKVDNGNNIVWNQCYGGFSLEQANSICNSNDGGLALAGYTMSNDSQVTGNHGRIDIWVLKVDSLGNFEWGKALGGTGLDIANSIIQTQDGGYLVAGYTTSNDGDISNNYGLEDAWLVKLAPPGLNIMNPEYSIMDLSVFQNDNSLTTRFFSRENYQASLKVFSISGQLIFEEKINVLEGINYYPLPINFSSGVYTVNINWQKYSVGLTVVVK